MCVLAVILQFAPLHNPATQSLPRLLELGGGYSLVWTRHGQAKTHSILHEIIEGLEQETRSLVILPTMVPQDQRSLVSLSPPSGIAITLPSERAPAGGDEFIQSAKIATRGRTTPFSWTCSRAHIGTSSGTESNRSRSPRKNSRL